MNRRNFHRRPGFTILELSIASILMGVVAIVLSHAWASFGRSALFAVGRARIAQEASLAIEAIARDVGRLARPAETTDGSRLTLWVDDRDGERPIAYVVDDSLRLVRIDGALQRVVADLVSDLQLRPATMPAGSGNVEIAGMEVKLNFSHHLLDHDPGRTSRDPSVRTYTLFIEDDPS